MFQIIFAIIKGKHGSQLFPSGIDLLEEFLKVFETCVISEAFYEYLKKQTHQKYLFCFLF